MNSPEPSRIRSAFAIGGPAFNLVLVAILMTITFLAVALPDRSVEAAGLGVVDAKGRSGVSVPRIVPATSTTTTTEPPPVEIELPPPAPEPVGVVPITTPVVQVTPDPPPPPPPPPPAPAPTPTTPSRPECRDFAQQPEAQVAFDADPATLGYFDGDGDGRACEELPGSPPEPPAVVAPPPVLSVAAVRDQQGIFGLHTREAPWFMGELDYVTRLIGKAPNNLLFFTNWAKPFPAEEVANTWSRGMTPQIAWEPVVPGADSQPRLQEIIDGEWDAYIDAWAAAAAAHGQPIVLRFASEMNGSWYPWSETGFGNSPGQYAPMWRHVHERFEAAGADNVVWLWSVNRVDNQPTDMTSYWPGEAYVDWVGISGYWRGYEAAPAPNFDAVFERTLGELRALTDKPIVLAEIGAGTDVDADRVEWLDTVFAGLAVNPDVIGFVYFNDQKAGGDWRIQFSQGMVDAFAAGIGDARWPSGVLPDGMEPGERVAVPAFGDPDVDLGQTPPTAPQTPNEAETPDDAEPEELAPADDADLGEEIPDGAEPQEETTTELVEAESTDPDDAGPDNAEPGDAESLVPDQHEEGTVQDGDPAESQPDGAEPDDADPSIIETPGQAETSDQPESADDTATQPELTSDPAAAIPAS